MKLKRYSIILVVYTTGKAWYKAKKGRNLYSMRSYFANRYNFRYAKIFDYHKKTGIGQKTGFFTRNQIQYN